ncbi:hypothetical protein D9757_011003 [Collybiopsis confluens]|uniref:Cerato-platanin n=1 Tax=Collybiopsis confluens TaxID=2823264 RepID=A0A8H5GD06_9AGAR|nr:hypothetical protein D9757_011003 [Collybiopsis confluens]
MKFFTSVFISAVAAATLAAAETLQYDPAYDVGSSSLATVACSDGANGLLTKGFSTFDSLPNFPNIGAFGQVAGFNSANCGTCWQVTYTASNGDSETLNILAVDHAGQGLINVSEEAMNTLTGGNAVAFGAVPVDIVQVASSACGL